MNTEKQSLHIPRGSYVGYIWLSDEAKPIVIPEQSDRYDLTQDGLDFSSDNNPFVVEGLLFDASRNLSITIKYVDGGYIVKEYLLDNMVSPNFKEVTYQSHRMDGRKLKFRQYWEEAEDEFCDDPQDTKGMKTLRPDKLVFVGFDNN